MGWGYRVGVEVLRAWLGFCEDGRGVFFFFGGRMGVKYTDIPRTSTCVYDTTHT